MSIFNVQSSLFRRDFFVYKWFFFDRKKKPHKCESLTKINLLWKKNQHSFCCWSYLILFLFLCSRRKTTKKFIQFLCFAHAYNKPRDAIFIIVINNSISIGGGLLFQWMRPVLFFDWHRRRCRCHAENVSRIKGSKQN